MMAMPAANIQALQAGLNLLKTIDLRKQMVNLSMPVDWILGNKDTLVKPSLAKELQQSELQMDVTVIDKAAHAPFLSHLEQFSEQLIKSLEKVV